MTKEATELLQRAMALPEQDRAELAGTLLESLDFLTDDDVEASWQLEVARQLQQLQSGEHKTISWTAVREKARAILDGNIHR